jgi:hypothetical protein
MIIQIDTYQDLDQIRAHVGGIPECELPCLLNVTLGMLPTIVPLDPSIRDRISVSAAIEQIKEDKLYEMIRDLSAYKIKELIKRLRNAV